MIVTQKDGIIGFGITKEESQMDWEAQALICNKFISERFKKRREELSPWMPEENVLHLSGIGCLRNNSIYITDVTTNKKITHDKTNSIFQILNELFQGKLSYYDIYVVLRDVLDKFFEVSKDKTTLISELPNIQLLSDEEFATSIIYDMKSTLILGANSEYMGVKEMLSSDWYVIPIDKSIDQKDSIYQLLSRAGYYISNNKIVGGLL